MTRKEIDNFGLSESISHIVPEDHLKEEDHFFTIRKINHIPLLERSN